MDIIHSTLWLPTHSLWFVVESFQSAGRQTGTINSRTFYDKEKINTIKVLAKAKQSFLFLYISYLSLPHTHLSTSTSTHLIVSFNISPAETVLGTIIDTRNSCIISWSYRLLRESNIRNISDTYHSSIILESLNLIVILLFTWKLTSQHEAVDNEMFLP